ncbi:hypothetical protein [Simplicispira suum]|uniref:Uncharacterized protein n=1 Tax=Simplicispira suum TaxID=2109915 RepID=A0A2S0N437_9BURK|nr:hypothetical protein [Simplicispira suum]AVO42910.1 hypothetical protein C6571_17835 [Simplicispira suum]MBW7833278.1 hypothetical protein [Simplicispira suum]
MAASPKPKATPPVKAAAKPASHRAAPTKPFLRFFHSAELRKKTLSVLELIENAPDATAHRGALADVVIVLMKSGFDGYFLAPLKKAKAGFLVEQSATVGLMGAQQVIGSVTRNIIGRMDAPQLLSVCGSIREMME